MMTFKTDFFFVLIELATWLTVTDKNLHAIKKKKKKEGYFQLPICYTVKN